MSKMLESVKGPRGEHFDITSAYDLSAAEVLSAIQKAFDGAEDGDVSLFFIATHGDVDATGNGRAICPDLCLGIAGGT